jgi:hypothetical protein
VHRQKRLEAGIKDKIADGDDEDWDDGDYDIECEYRP